MERSILKELSLFLETSPSCFHAIDNIKNILFGEQFTQLHENKKWKLNNGSRYFVTRNDSSIIAFTVPDREMAGMRIIASHSDSPAFKVKENPELETDGQYIRLNVERYGGMLCAPWLDRPLSVAGRVIVKDRQRGLCSRLVNIDRDLLLIPNLAIHMNREANDGYKYNAQKDMLPLYGAFTAKGTFMKLIADAAGVEESDILGQDLFLYNRQKEAYGELRKNSSPAGVWMTSSVPLHPSKGSLPGRRHLTWLYTAYWTVKRWATRPNRARRPLSCMTHLHGSTTAFVTRTRII